MSRSNDIANITASVLDGVTATEVGLGNVTNESKATMFTSPTFTGDVSATNIKHASSNSNNLVLASDGTTTTTLSSSANIKSAINASGSAPIYACRAWVNFNVLMEPRRPTLTVSPNLSAEVGSVTTQ